LVTRDRGATLAGHKRPYAQDEPPITGLIEAIRKIRPTVLIGVSGQPGLFTEEALREMHRHCARPIVFPLSNPTAKAECTPEQAYAWTNGSALVATGSPFPPVTIGSRLMLPGQCNNLYVFPGLGMGAVSCGASRVTEVMFSEAARILSQQVGEDSLGVGRLFPDLTQIREISARIAAAVCEVAFEQGLARIERPDDLEGFIRGRMFHPRYVPYEPV
jgi:malate dehydrogenase (oxaloacetate-decarboxylating)(NADP+)